MPTGQREKQREEVLANLHDSLQLSCLQVFLSYCRYRENIGPQCFEHQLAAAALPFLIVAMDQAKAHLTTWHGPASGLLLATRGPGQTCCSHGYRGKTSRIKHRNMETKTT
ncbi:hypothetical protein TEQG_04968 [Trichophyton equinum CBS 127.97]|uniref:Uncharacterized protein n=1 Tax=Trichophyton equinum (strain ATCC MYA-4606 / CBS 127.97) TaxID=559882 RepID=F2PVP3_TRIEC|nr:hypothetical protein TEQG_04968 [Trichophyton equinum CBS 127.97]